MNIKQRINEDLKNALKEGKDLVVSTLRLMLSALHNREIEKRTKERDVNLTEDEVIEVLQKEAKKREEAILFYEKGQRVDLVQKEKEELEIIRKYLPPSLTEEEIIEEIKEALEVLGTKTKRDFGKLMSFLMKKLKGRVDGEKVAELLKERLE